jgi:hypothetical protein
MPQTPAHTARHTLLLLAVAGLEELWAAAAALEGCCQELLY